MEAHTTALPRPRVVFRPTRSLALAHGVTIGAVASAVLLTSARWNLWAIVLISTLSIVSDLTSVRTGSTLLRISGSFLGLMLAAVLLGAAPAALIGILTVAGGWFGTRESAHYFRNNLITYAAFPAIGGAFFHATTQLAHVGPADSGYYLLVFVTFTLALLANFIGIAGYQCHLDGASLSDKAREALVPILSSELFSALLTMLGVYMAVHLGAAGIAMLGVVLVVFQYLVGELLESKRRSEELHRLATTDELTGLANRERFRDELVERIGGRELGAQPFGVILMDLDHFKEINDTLGHDCGDVLLQELGQRLAACAGTDGVVARLGGDEFALLPAERSDDPKMLEQFALRLLSCVRSPFAVEALSLELDASIGIARYPLDGGDPHTLLRRADLAMYAAKEAQSGCRFYAPEQDNRSRRRLSVLSDFRRAIEAGEIVVHYQPIVDLDGLRVRGAEGLVRWDHPRQGMLPPGAFIQDVEQTGLIGPLTGHVLDQAIAQCADWRRDHDEMSVAVNLSARNLLDRQLPAQVEHMLSRHRLPPEALQLEITESMIMSDPERALGTVTELSALGVRFSVDDFGTGYSSLAYLRRLPIDELKIDRSFVSPMLNDSSDLIIVRSTINLGHDLGLKIIAEGVEDEPTLARLVDLGCDRAQGYHLSRPMSPRAFTDWLRLHFDRGRLRTRD